MEHTSELDTNKIHEAAQEAYRSETAKTKGLNGWSAERRVGRAIHLAMMKEIERQKKEIEKSHRTT